VGKLLSKVGRALWFVTNVVTSEPVQVPVAEAEAADAAQSTPEDEALTAMEVDRGQSLMSNLWSINHLPVTIFRGLKVYPAMSWIICHTRVKKEPIFVLSPVRS